MNLDKVDKKLILFMPVEFLKIKTRSIYANTEPNGSFCPKMVTVRIERKKGKAEQENMENSQYWWLGHNKKYVFGLCFHLCPIEHSS